MIDTSNFPIAYSPLPIIKTWIDESVGLKRKKIICYNLIALLMMGL